MLLNHPFATEHTQLHGFLSSLLNDSSLAPLLESCQAPCFALLAALLKDMEGKLKKAGT